MDPETYHGALDASEIERYIADNCADASLGRVGEVFSCHPNSINRLLKAQRGSTFRETLTHARARRAKELLDAGATVQQAAKACGYESLSHFYSAFEKDVGLTPGAYRRLAHQDGASQAEPSAHPTRR